MKKRLLSIFICVVMLLGISPTTVFAAEPTEIREIKSVMAVDRVPKAGMEVDLFMPNVPDGEPYQRYYSGTYWYDENGVLIAPTISHWYDLGYEFEAGRIYYADLKYTADNGYVFAEDPVITFTGPDPSMFTYEIVDRWENDEGVTVRYTFTIPGEFDYPDINKVSMMYYGTVADNYKKPDPCEMIYNNCTITREEWNAGEWGSEANWGVYTADDSNDPTFLAGNTYVHMIELTAKDGYKFSEGLHVQKGRQGYEEYGVVSLSEDNTVATVKFTYDVGEFEIIDTVELVAVNQHVNFMLRSGESVYLPQPFMAKYALADDCPYKADSQGSCKWIVDETGENLRIGYPQSFDAGKTYTLKFSVRIKDEYETTHKFAKGVSLDVSNYTYADSDLVKFKISGSGQIVDVEVTFTAQFPVGAGSSANNPAFCYSYEEFKYAMESPDIRFVALGDVDDIITKVEGDGLIPAISVNGIKHLNVIGNATFTAPANDDGYKTICALLHTTQGDTLTVSGAGKLKFRAVANNSYNAVIYNQGGSVIIDSNGALIGSYNTAVYGKAIWQEYGELRISGGEFFAENALAPGSLPQSHSAVYINGGQAWIQGGTFKTESHIDTIDLHYGLDIGQYATVDLSGGTFYGILLPTSSTLLANYMDEETYTPLSDESRFNPESEYSQNYTASGKVVRIAWLIDHVDVHINSPIAGVDISENYFNIPTSGCKVTMYYPQWYKNGEAVPFGTFEAGASYKVVVWVDAKADYGAEFSNGVTVAINNQSVAVDRKSSHLIAVEYDFGVCPDVVNTVELTVKAPKEGNTPSYIVSDESKAYDAVTDLVDDANVRRWFESANGESNWREMSRTDKYKAGYYYRLYVDVNTLSGNQFAVYDNGSSIVPDVSATVNGYYANVIKAYEQDPSEYITVKYDFGICNDSVIESVAVVDVKAPVAGEKPQFVCNLLGTGYGAQNLDDTWYRINSITWKDEDSFNTYLGEDDVFVPGRRYRFTVYIEAEEGYEFATTKDGYARPQNTATVNGKAATAILPTSNATTKQEIVYIFTCEQEEIDTVILYDLDAPEGGKTPDRTITAAYPEFYNVEELIWYDCEDNVVSGEETFRQGEQYKVQIKVVPTQSNGYDVCKFITPARAYIDSEEVSERLNWDEVYVSDGAMYIKYTFIKGASAPEIEIEEYTYYYFPTEAQGSADFDVVVSGTEITLAECMFEAPEGKTFLGWAVGNINAELKQPGEKIVITGETYIYAVWSGGYTISGTVTAFSDWDTTVELLKDGEVIDFMDTSSAYSFEDVTEGEYTLRVSKSKHATREYEVTVAGEDVIQDVEIWLYGDVTKDGNVNNSDVIQINRSINNMNSVFSQAADLAYRLKVANVTAITGSDIVVNNADAMQINRKINNMSSVFSTL